jgi:hypothetical protein
MIAMAARAANNLVNVVLLGSTGPADALRPPSRPRIFGIAGKIDVQNDQLSRRSLSLSSNFAFHDAQVAATF